MKFFHMPLVILLNGLVISSAISQEKTSITVHVNKPGAEIQPTMWGVFFEDINLGADGGIYAELVKNRSFEFQKPLMGWKVEQNPFREGAVRILNRSEKNEANPRFIRIDAGNETRGTLGLTNEGFRGMGIKKDLPYEFSIMYRQEKTGVTLHIELTDSLGKVLGHGMLTPSATGSGWHKQSVRFTSTATEPKGKMNIWFEGTGVIDLDMISLFPGDTWKNRPGGMRADMIQMLADLKPGFLRFPGGCIVEGHELATRYQWKKTIGTVDQRQLIINRWNTEFAHRPTPDYFQTFGLGFFEYFQLAEDIGASPLPILNCGMACQFNTAELVPMDQLDPFVQDALDLIEFANGDPSTQWGKVRADMGHPAPFNLKMMGVGNENWGPQYVERLRIFQQAIKQKYPAIQIVASSGTDPVGDRFEYLDGELRKMQVDIIDEHYYRRPEWFLENASRYDNYTRSGPKIFAGEYAAQSDRTVSVNNQNNLQTAISEAAFLTGLERNADLVVMASYAPLFAHVDGWQWRPDLIWVDNLRVTGTPNYYVQKLFSTNRGTHIIPALNQDKPIAGENNLYVSSVLDKAEKLAIIKLVNSSSDSRAVSISLSGAGRTGSEASVSVLTGNSPEQVNDLDHPFSVSPREKSVAVKRRKIDIDLDPHSLTVIRVNLK